jgi:hypothetical protein
MAVSRGSKAAVAGATTRVTFEVERFGWVADDRLEVAGRWFGLRGHRFLRPTLDIEVDGHHRRLLALLEHKPWAVDDGDEWVAAFSWQGEPVHIPGAELAVGPDLTIELPAPAGGRSPASKRAGPQTREVLAAGRPRSDIELDLATARDEAERLAGELERQRATHAARAEELQRRLSAEHEAVASLKEELAAARAAAAAREAESSRQIEEVSAERDAAVASSSSALAETKRVESERDAALRKRAAIEQERDAAVRARDSARQERNAWMSRARVALAEQSTPAAGTVRRRPVAAQEPAKAEHAPAKERRAGAAVPAAQPPRPRPARARPLAAAPSDDDPRPARRDAPLRGEGDVVRAPRAPARPSAGDGRPGRAVAPSDGGAPDGVRTVKIGFYESPPGSPRSGARAPDELATPLLGVPPGRTGPRPTIPLWASRLVAALLLVIAVAIVALLVL